MSPGSETSEALGDDSNEEIQSSTPGSTGPDRAAGDMGVSSERVGPDRPGPGRHRRPARRLAARAVPEEETFPSSRPATLRDNSVGSPKAG